MSRQLHMICLTFPPHPSFPRYIFICNCQIMCGHFTCPLRAWGCILHSLDLVACLILRCSVNSAEWIHGRREKLFHYSITLSLRSWICQLHWANSTNKSALPMLRSHKTLEQWGTEISPSLPSGDTLELEEESDVGPGWLYSQDTCHKVNGTTTILSPFPLALLHREDPLSPP